MTSEEMSFENVYGRRRTVNVLVDLRIICVSQCYAFVIFWFLFKKNMLITSEVLSNKSRFGGQKKSRLFHKREAQDISTYN